MTINLFTNMQSFNLYGTSTFNPVFGGVSTPPIFSSPQNNAPITYHNIFINAFNSGLDTQASGFSIKNYVKDYAQDFKTKTSSNRVQQALELARSQIGVRENGNSNDSAEIRKYKNGAVNGNPWCASFTSWLYGRGQNSSNRDTFGYTASSQEIMRAADAKGHFARKNSGYTPKAGDLIVWTKKSNSAQGHVGIVDRVTSEGVYTIEGNSSNQVKRKFYPFNKMNISNDLQFSGYAKMNEWAA